MNTTDSSKPKNSSRLKVLGIAGSPRRDGNTDLLLRQVMAGAADLHAKTKTIILSDLNIAPCRHCDGCINTGKCVVEDDMQWLHNDIREADRLVLASPVFFMGLTAQTKAMIDRCQALWVIKYILKLPVSSSKNKGHRGIFVSVGGRNLNNLFQPSIATVKGWFTTIDIKYDGELVFPSIDEKGAISKHPTALKDAFVLGQKLATD